MVAIFSRSPTVAIPFGEIEIGRDGPGHEKHRLPGNIGDVVDYVGLFCWGYQVVVGGHMPGRARLDAPGALPASPERSDGGQVIVRGIEKRRIDDVRRHRDNSGSIGTMFSHGFARRKRRPEAHMASTLRRGIPENRNAELVGGGLAIIRGVSK